jgi:hypothetical protein
MTTHNKMNETNTQYYQRYLEDMEKNIFEKFKYTQSEEDGKFYTQTTLKELYNDNRKNIALAIGKSENNPDGVYIVDASEKLSKDVTNTIDSKTKAKGKYYIVTPVLVAVNETVTANMSEPEKKRYMLSLKYQNSSSSSTTTYPTGE